MASFNEPQHQFAAGALKGTGLPVEVHLGRTPEIIRLADACMSVSGSVGLELVNQAVPSVVYYQISVTQWLLARLLLKIRHVSLINLLAGAEIVPELLPLRPSGTAIANHVIRWLTNENARAEVRAKMLAVRERVAEPGACARAAEYILHVVQRHEEVGAVD